MLHFPRIIVSLIAFVLFLSLSVAYAQTTSNNNYTIEQQELEQKTFHTKPNKPKESERILRGDKYEAVLGYEDIQSENLFSLTSSGSVVDYGKIYPTTPIVRALNLKIKSTSARGYSVFVSQNHPLADVQFVNLIPDTTCDRGLCSKSIGAPWQDNLTYGLGYACENIEGDLCTLEENDFFKKFPDESKAEDPQILFQSTGGDHEGKILLKLNISSSQTPEVYSNTTSFILIPNL